MWETEMGTERLRVRERESGKERELGGRDGRSFFCSFETIQEWLETLCICDKESAIHTIPCRCLHPRSSGRWQQNPYLIRGQGEHPSWCSPYSCSHSLQSGPIPSIMKALTRFSKALLTSYLPEAETQTATDHPVWGSPDSSPRDGMISGQISRTKFDWWMLPASPQSSCHPHGHHRENWPLEAIWSNRGASSNTGNRTAHGSVQQ